ncbi:formate dehydrogenase accessory sulfurtransferase FdhD [Polaribacter sp.]|uniref:formate dehydrogenase accessory sulfurtransferase FdhD n=1 Tax=Polaribacter sp. TaxID=1920175 RepID=UPI003F6BB18D
MQTANYKGLKITSNNHFNIDDFLVIEAPLQININQEPYTVVMRTPNDDFELIRGLLFAEDIYKKSENLSFNIEKQEENIPSIINATINQQNLGSGYLNKRTLLSVSSCGICGKKELKDLQIHGNSLPTEVITSTQNLHKMHDIMKGLQETFKKSGGSHAAAIFNKQQQLLCIKEDIGRHNAVDKSIGRLLQTKTLKNAHYLLVSGRVSYEIVTKAFMAKIPVIVAISSCSSLAVDFAKEFGICLIGFTRNQKMTIYANTQYIHNQVKDA